MIAQSILTGQMQNGGYNLHVPEEFQFVASHVALDFANTLDNRYKPEKAVDLLGTYGDLLRFCRQAGLLSVHAASRLAKHVSSNDAEAALERGRDLREALERIFQARARGERASMLDLHALNRNLQEALKHRKIVECDGHFEWEWEYLDKDATAPIWPIALAAAELLASDQVNHVAACRDQTCRWLFLDTSKNHSRRWCDMKTCGNRNKAKRYYSRAE